MTFWVSQSKDRAYVANVVSWYRQRLDSALAARGWRRSSSGHSSAGFEPDVTKTFNRGFTPYFVQGRQEPPGAVDSPKMVGEYLGTVTASRAGVFSWIRKYPFTAAMACAGSTQGSELTGTTVNATQPAGQVGPWRSSHAGTRWPASAKGCVSIATVTTSS